MEELFLCIFLGLLGTEILVVIIVLYYNGKFLEVQRRALEISELRWWRDNDQCQSDKLSPPVE